VKGENPWGGTYVFVKGTDANTLTVSGVSAKGATKLSEMMGLTLADGKYSKTFDDFVVEVVPAS